MVALVALENRYFLEKKIKNKIERIKKAAP